MVKEPRWLNNKERRMFMNLFSSKFFRRAVIAFVATTFVFGGFVSSYARIIENDHLRKPSLAQSQARGEIVNALKDGGNRPWFAIEEDMINGMAAGDSSRVYDFRADPVQFKSEWLKKDEICKLWEEGQIGLVDKPAFGGRVWVYKAAPELPLSKQLVVHYSQVGKEDVAIVGGKNANLGELIKIPEIAPMVPRFVAVTTQAFKVHMNKATTTYEGKTMSLKEYVESRLKKLEAAPGGYENTEELGKAGEDIRAAISAAQMPVEVRQAIVEGYRSLCKELGVEDMAVAVRSSATAEDTQDASFAGQQDTYLNMIGAEQVVDAVQRNWASLFTERAIYYRHEQKIAHDTAFLSAVIQQMINSKTAGTMFTVDVNTGANKIKIDASWGPGESVVSGAATPDTALVDRRNLNVLRHDFGSKLVKFVLKNEKNIKAKEGILKVDTSYEERHMYCQTDEQYKQIAKAGLAIEKHYGRFMDIEWAYDQQGNLKILQARPETIWNKWEESNPKTVKIENTVIEDAVAKKGTILLSGVVGRGAVSGKVVIVDSELEGAALGKELTKIQKGDIMVTKMTTPDMVPVMKRAGGFITNEGGPTCHAAIVARELKKSAVVGTKDATARLQDGQVVTLDANRGKIYVGELPIVTLSDNVDITKLPKIHTKVGVIVASPSLALGVNGLSDYASHYGVSLMRKEMTDQVEIFIHPLAGLAYDKYYDPNFKDEAAKAWIKKNIIDNDELNTFIKETINGYKTFREFFVDKLGNAIATIAASQNGDQPVLFRTTDFKTNEYRDQPGGILYEPHENNPMMGFRGIYRMLSDSYREAFLMEIDAVKKAREFQKNVVVMFPVVRTPKELKAAVDLLASRGLVRGQDGFQIAMMDEVPANTLLAKKFYQYVDRMSIGSNDKTQFGLGKGRDNEQVQKIFNEADPAVLNALEYDIKIARQMGVKTGLCGQRPSNDPAFAATLAKFGIESIGVVPESYKNVVNVLAEAEKTAVVDLDHTAFEVPETAGNPGRVAGIKVNAANVIKAVGVHPLVLMQYAKGELKDEALKAAIEKRLDGRKAKDVVVDVVYTAMKVAANSVPADQTVVYATDDLVKTDYDQMIGGAGLEQYDENPRLGFMGMSRVLDPAYRELFAWQLEGIQKMRSESGRKNVWVQLNVALFQDVGPAIEMMKSAGLTPGTDDFRVGLEIDTLANLTRLSEYVDAGIAFFTENRNRFLAYMQAADPSELVQIDKESQDELMDAGRNVWTTVAEKKGIPMANLTELPILTKADGGAVVEELELKNASQIDALQKQAPELLRNIRINGAQIYELQNAGFGDMLQLIKKSEAKPAAIVTAKVILDNSAAINTFKNLQASGVQVFVWGKAGIDDTRLRMLNVDQFATIVISEKLEDVMKILQAKGIDAKQVALYNAGEKIGESAIGQVQTIVNLAKPFVVWADSQKPHTVNLVPLAVSRGMAGVMKDNAEVVAQFNQMVDANKDRIPEEKLAELKNLDQQIAEMPLVTPTNTEANKQSEFDTHMIILESVANRV
jgi:pyruvate, water dikinase